MGLPQYILLGIYMLSLGVSLALDGKPRTGKHNFISSVIMFGIVIFLLAWGGFFG